MADTVINDYIELARAPKQLIDQNRDKIFKHYDLFDDNIIKELKGCNINSLYMKYYGLIDNVARFINKYDIDISSTEESIVNKIHKHRRINAPIIAEYSEPEDESEDESEELKNESEEETPANNIKKQHKPCELKDKSNNSTAYNLLNNIISQNAITSNNDEVMKATLQTLQILINNKLNNAPQINTLQINSTSK